MHTEQPGDHAFTAPIGVDVKGEVWSCVEVPHARETFGSLRAVRVDAQVDDLALPDVGLMPTGSGGLMLSLNATIRKQLAKDVGDTVMVRLTRRG